MLKVKNALPYNRLLKIYILRKNTNYYDKNTIPYCRNTKSMVRICQIRLIFTKSYDKITKHLQTVHDMPTFASEKNKKKTVSIL